MVVVGVIIGVVWVLLLALVLTVCRAAGRADAREERLARPDLSSLPELADRPPTTPWRARIRRPRRARLPTRVV